MTRKITFMKAINEALEQSMERDDRVILLGEDIAGGAKVPHLEESNEDAWGGVFGVTKGLMPKFGRERVIDTPISEMGYMGAAVGAAATGLRPVPELMFNDFIGFCFDTILAQGSQMRYDNIVIFSEDKTLYGLKGEVPEEYYTVEIGKAKVKQEGTDLTIVTIGKMLYVALEVADKLSKDGISVEVIDLVTVAPWDQETIIQSVKKTGRLIVIDEANPHNNTATDIASIVGDKAFDYLDGPIKCVCAPNTPVPFATNLEQLYLPNADRVLETANELIADLKK